MTTPVDPVVLGAAAAVIAEHGWHELTLERVAAAAGMSRVTLYRRGITKDAIVAALAHRAAQEWQAAMWPVLTGPGSAADRLRAALLATCAAVELHLSLLSGPGAGPAVELPFDGPTAGGAAAVGPDSAAGELYAAPFARLLRDGALDGSLAPQPDPVLAAGALLSMVPRTYVHLRTVRSVAPDAAARLLTELLLDGVLPRGP